VKSLLVWVAAIVGGGAVGAVGGTAWLVYTGAGAAEEATEGVPVPASQTEDPGVAAARGDDALGVLSGREPSDPAAQDPEAGPEGTDPRTTADDTPSEPEAAGRPAAAPDEPEPASPGPDATEGSTREPPPGGPVQPNPNHERLGRIFAAMKAEEAASVLGQLDDKEIQGILMTMPARNAAPILARLDPARAASLSRRVLGEGGP